MTVPSISIASLWRYPVKGLNGETLTDVELRPAAPFPGDRAYAIEFRPTDYDPAAPSFVKKSYFYQLALFPELARISCRFDAGETLELRLDEKPLARFSLEDPAAPGNFQKALIALLGQSPAHPPKLIGGGPGRFTDQSRPLISIINLASVAATGEALGTMLDPVRFRGNIYLDNLPAWQETALIGRTLKLGETAEVKVVDPITRCAATEVDPKSARRDQPVVDTLRELTGLADCGVFVEVVRGGSAKPGDRIEVL